MWVKFNILNTGKLSGTVDGILAAIIAVSRDFTFWQTAGIYGPCQNTQVQFFMLKAFIYVRTWLLFGSSSSSDHIPMGMCVLKIKGGICILFFFFKDPWSYTAFTRRPNVYFGKSWNVKWTSHGNLVQTKALHVMNKYLWTFTFPHWNMVSLNMSC